MAETKLTETFAIRHAQFGAPRDRDAYELVEGGAGGRMIVRAGTLTDVAALGRALVAFAEGCSTPVAPLTVGAALADPRVQAGTHAVECFDTGGTWRQLAVSRDGWLTQRLHIDTWTTWAKGPTGAVLYPLAARIVPLTTADLDPATRINAGDC